MEKKTSEKTDEELKIAYEAYIQSKTVDGRYCPTPDLHKDDSEIYWEEDIWRGTVDKKQ